MLLWHAKPVIASRFGVIHTDKAMKCNLPQSTSEHQAQARGLLQSPQNLVSQIPQRFWLTLQGKISVAGEFEIRHSRSIYLRFLEPPKGHNSIIKVKDIALSIATARVILPCMRSRTSPTTRCKCKMHCKLVEEQWKSLKSFWWLVSHPHGLHFALKLQPSQQLMQVRYEAEQEVISIVMMIQSDDLKQGACTLECRTDHRERPHECGGESDVLGLLACRQAFPGQGYQLCTQ